MPADISGLWSFIKRALLNINLFCLIKWNAVLSSKFFACQNNAFQYTGDVILHIKTDWEQQDPQQVWELSSTALTSKTLQNLSMANCTTHRHRAKLVSFRDLGVTRRNMRAACSHSSQHRGTDPLWLVITNHHTKSQPIVLAILQLPYKLPQYCTQPKKKSYLTW